MNRKVKTEIIGIQAHAANGRHNNHMDNGNGSGSRISNDPAPANGAAPAYSSVVERYALLFDRPEDRLRFVNNTLTKQADRTNRLRRRFRFFERIGLYDRLLEARCYSAILEEMRAMSSSLPKDRRRLAERVHAPFSARVSFLIHETRHAFYGASAAIAVLMVLVFYSFGMWSARVANAYLKSKYSVEGASAPMPSPTPNPANDIFTKSEKIFLYKTEGGVEKWSNGCLISTKYETNNHPRAYYTIPRGAETDGEQKTDKIVGIVYHTPESYVIEFDEKNSRALQAGSRGLLEHDQK